MASLLQRLQAKIEEYQRQNPDAEITADVEAEIMQKLAEERLPKNTVIEAKKASSEKDNGIESTEPTNVTQSADNTDKTSTTERKESSAEAGENLQQQEYSASKDPKDDSAEGDAEGEQKDGSDETPAHKSMPDGGKDDGEQQRSDIPADEQDEILEDSALRPGLTTSKSEMAADEQQGGVDAGDNANQQNATGQQDTSHAAPEDAEVKAAGDNDSSTKASNLDELKGLEVNADGMIYDSQGNMVARLAEGDPDELAGWTIGDKGEILDDDGDLIGTVELIKNEHSPDESKETVEQESANEGKIEAVQSEAAGGLDTDRGKDEATIAALGREDDNEETASKEPGSSQQAEAGVEHTADGAAGDSQQVDADSEEPSNEAAGDSPQVDASAENSTDKATGDSQQVDNNVEEESGEAAGDESLLDADGEQNANKAAGDSLNADADVGETVEEAAGDSRQVDADPGETSKRATDEPSKMAADAKQAGDEEPSQVDSAEEQTPKKGVSGKKPPRKLQARPRAPGVNSNQETEKAGGEVQQTEDGANADKVDLVDESVAKDGNNSAQGTEEMNQDDADKQACGEAQSSEADPQNEPPKDSEQPKDAVPSEAPFKTSKDDEIDSLEEPTRQDSVMQDVSESKEKQDEIIGDSQEVRPDPRDAQEVESGKQDEQSKDDQETDTKDEVNARADEQDDEAEDGTTKNDDAEVTETDANEIGEANDDGMRKEARNDALQLAQSDDEQADDPKVDEQEVKSSQAANGSAEKENVDEDSGAQTAKEEVAEQPEQQNSKARPSDEAHDAMDTHNKARQDKGTQPLRWDDELASEAAEFAQKLSKSRKYQHSGVEEYGENVFVGIEDTSYEQAVQSWLAEETDYEGAKFGEGNVARYARFTQCMWHNSSHFGIAKATSKHGGTFIVARYWPQGNVVGEKPY